jgi:hypothetical protein
MSKSRRFHQDRYGDVALVLLAAPILLLAGVPALGYGIGAAAWILLRGLGLAVDRHASASSELSQQLALRVGYRFARVLLLVTATVVSIKVSGRSDGLTALLVISVAFTAQLGSVLYARRVHPVPPASVSSGLLEHEPVVVEQLPLEADLVRADTGGERHAEVSAGEPPRQ